jgi:hypothetical protein
MYSKELILAGKVKLHGSMAQAKVQSFEPESNLLVYSHLGNADCDKIVTYGEFPHSSQASICPILPFCIVL